MTKFALYLNARCLLQTVKLFWRSLILCDGNNPTKFKLIPVPPKPPTWILTLRRLACSFTIRTDRPAPTCEGVLTARDAALRRTSQGETSLGFVVSSCNSHANWKCMCAHTHTHTHTAQVSEHSLYRPLRFISQLKAETATFYCNKQLASFEKLRRSAAAATTCCLEKICIVVQ